jgi:hypothetical protein
MSTRVAAAAFALALIVSSSFGRPLKAGVIATASKAFGAASIPVGGTTTLTFTLINSSGGPITFAFTDVLPAGVQLVNPVNVTFSAGCGPGSLSATLPGTMVASDQVPAASTCLINAAVVGFSIGPQVNTTTTVSVSSGGTLPAMTASILVTAAVPVIGPAGLGLLAMLLMGLAVVALRRRSVRTA